MFGKTRFYFGPVDIPCLVFFLDHQPLRHLRAMQDLRKPAHKLNVGRPMFELPQLLVLVLENLQGFLALRLDCFFLVWYKTLWPLQTTDVLFYFHRYPYWLEP